MGENAPDALYHYTQLRKGIEGRVLPKKVTELILLGINLVRHYEFGIRVHIKGAIDAGATIDEICETIVNAMISGAATAIVEGPKILQEELNKRNQ